MTATKSTRATLCSRPHLGFRARTRGAGEAMGPSAAASSATAFRSLRRSTPVPGCKPPHNAMPRPPQDTTIVVITRRRSGWLDANGCRSWRADDAHVQQYQTEAKRRWTFRNATPKCQGRKERSDMTYGSPALHIANVGVSPRRMTPMRRATSCTLRAFTDAVSFDGRHAVSDMPTGWHGAGSARPRPEDIAGGRGHHADEPWPSPGAACSSPSRR